ncbi:hypothetical protein J6590_029616 [Homalodisca vitripennis]|nr:hypothetical protein J6590_029616 [Homalodisca vitripennis]
MFAIPGSDCYSTPVTRSGRYTVPTALSLPSQYPALQGSVFKSLITYGLSGEVRTGISAVPIQHIVTRPSDPVQCRRHLQILHNFLHTTPLSDCAHLYTPLPPALLGMQYISDAILPIIGRITVEALREAVG